MEARTFNEDDKFNIDGIEISSIPAMSTDGMLPEQKKSCNLDGFGNGNDGQRMTTETEEEYAVIEQGEDYKLSIMRKKRPLII